MQKDFCLFLLDMMPSLREYGNISYQGQRSSERQDPESTNLSPNGEPSAAPPFKHKNRNTSAKSDVRTVVPILAIDIPD